MRLATTRSARTALVCASVALLAGCSLVLENDFQFPEEGMTDAAQSDAARMDAGSSDAGSSDAGSSDAGSSDAGSFDAESSDGGLVLGDDASSDAAAPDAWGGGCAEGLCDPPASLAVGFDFSCALRETGRVQCWGLNTSGQLGDGTLVDRGVPAPISSAIRFTQLAAQVSSVCGISEGGELFCWGRNLYAELGNGTVSNQTSPSPVVADDADAAVFAARSFISVVGLQSGACALDDVGEVWCWGRNLYGEVGSGTIGTTNRATRVSGLSSVVELAAGNSFACARHASGTISCWGYNVFGQLGDGTNTSSSTPVAVTGITNATRIVATQVSMCALVSSAGNVRCWGSNGVGELGRVGAHSNTPVSNGVGADELICGGSFCFARSATRGWLGWGLRSVGQLGDEVNATPIVNPIELAIDPALDLFTSSVSQSVCQIIDHRVRCWGFDHVGQLGDYPRAVEPPTAAVDEGGLLHASGLSSPARGSCFIVLGGEVRCAGDNTSWALGVPASLAATATPMAIALRPGLEALQIESGANYSCALAREGAGSHEVWCWGNSPAGAPTASPAEKTGFSGEPIAISGGGAHVCAIVVDGVGSHVECWGANTSGALGQDPAVVTSSTSPAPITASPTDVTQLACGYDTCCLTRAAGEIRCWGNNAEGTLGAGTAGGRSHTPVVATQLAGASHLAIGDGFGCLIDGEGAVSCWGRNDRGMLGAATPAGRSVTPIDVTLPGDATAIAAGGEMACAVVAGEAYCWGANETGQLGRGTQSAMETPLAISGLSGVTRVSVAQGYRNLSKHACALLDDGRVFCWGNPSFGRLADGRALWTVTPVGPPPFTD